MFALVFSVCLVAFVVVPKSLFNYKPILTNEIIFVLIATLAIGILYVVIKRLFELFFKYGIKRVKK